MIRSRGEKYFGRSRRRALPDDQIRTRIVQAKTRTKNMEFRIHQAQSPEFIERAARYQFDLVKEGDLVFIFSDGTAETSEKTENSFN